MRQGCSLLLKGSMLALGKALSDFEGPSALLERGGYCATSPDRTVGESRWIYSQQEAMRSLSGISRGPTSRGAKRWMRSTCAAGLSLAAFVDSFTGKRSSFFPHGAWSEQWSAEQNQTMSEDAL